VQKHLTVNGYSHFHTSFLSPAKCMSPQIRTLPKQDTFQPAEDMEQGKMVKLKVRAEELPKHFQQRYSYWQEGVTAKVDTCISDCMQ
jgi:hypothetical protein